MGRPRLDKKQFHVKLDNFSELAMREIADAEGCTLSDAIGHSLRTYLQNQYPERYSKVKKELDNI